MRLTSACAVLTMEAARWSLLLALRKETFAAATASSSVDDPTAKLHYNRQNPLKLDQLPDTGEEWQTLSNGIQVQPASNLSPLAQEHLRRLTSTGSNGTDWETSAYEKMFVDGAETYYDEYAQAWRALGFYIDCDYCDPDRGCWWDQSNNNGNQDDHDQQSSGCQRFLLWAAYVDEGYTGHGVNEYKYWDRQNKQWDATACTYGYSQRCAKMDCHLSNTHFSLLGFFKEPHYDEWMEQLFKHEGACVWTTTEYLFMQQNREAWPNGCTKTTYTTGESSAASSPIYYDLKPMPYGDFGIGLYSDSACIHDYKGNVTAEMVVDKMQQYYNGANNNNDQNQGQQGGYTGTLTQELKLWNAAFEVYKQCQPCKTYDLSYIVRGNRNLNNPDSNLVESDKDDGGERDLQQNNAYYNKAAYYYNNGYYYKKQSFHCYDDAGYDNVNQCMKFATHTSMMTASWRDLELAGAQGTITLVQVGGSLNNSWAYSQTVSSTTFGTSLDAKETDFHQRLVALVLTGMSVVLFCAAVVHYLGMKKLHRPKSMQESMEEELTRFYSANPSGCT